LKLRRLVDVDVEGEPVGEEQAGEENPCAAQARHCDRGRGQQRDQGGQQIAVEDEVLARGRRCDGKDHGPRPDHCSRRRAPRVGAPTQQRGESDKQQQSRYQRESVGLPLADQLAGLADHEADPGVHQPPQHRVTRDPVGMSEAGLVKRQRRKRHAGGPDHGDRQDHRPSPVHGSRGQ
jgi:hypothetical protein